MARLGRPFATLAICASLVSLCAAPARAYEDQYTVGLGLGYAQALRDSSLESGALFDLSMSSGISPAWTLRGRMSYGFGGARGERHHVGIAAAELLTQLDVLAFVPYAGIGAGVVLLASRDRLRLSPSPHCVLGLDYLLTRALTLELDARAHLLLTELSSALLYWGAVLSLVWMIDA